MQFQLLELVSIFMLSGPVSAVALAIFMVFHLIVEYPNIRKAAINERTELMCSNYEAYHKERVEFRDALSAVYTRPQVAVIRLRTSIFTPKTKRVRKLLQSVHETGEPKDELVKALLGFENHNSDGEGKEDEPKGLEEAEQ